MEAIGKILGLFLSSALLAILGAAAIKFTYNKASPSKINYAKAYKLSISAFVAGAAAAAPAFYILATQVSEAVTGVIVGCIAITVHLFVIHVQITNEKLTLKNSVLIGFANIIAPTLMIAVIVSTVGWITKI